MNNSIGKNDPLFFSPLVAAAVSGGVSLLGVFGALAFGPAGGAAAAIVSAAFTFFLFRSRSAPLSGERSPIAAPADEKVIPPDRIDQLTGLANENGLIAWFMEKGPRFAAEGMELIVLCARLDDFPAIIVSKGQEVADAVLKEIAHRVSVVSGSDGIAARTDGEEFASVVAVVPARSASVAEEKAGHLVELICRPVEYAGSVVWGGGAVGGAVGAPTDGPAILERARGALAQASRMGRGQFYVARQ